jgi:hypothetical protein
MVGKIFEILAGIKKTSQITKSASVESVDKIVAEIMSGNINPVEAYVILDYLTKVTAESLKNIKPAALDHIQKEGENIAFGVQLNLAETKDYSYEEDKDWTETNRKMSQFKNALQVREKFLKGLVAEAIEADKPTPISYTTSIRITPKPLY